MRKYGWVMQLTLVLWGLSSPGAATPAEPSDAKSNAAAVAGTWVLQQVSGIEDLKRVEPAISAALTNFETVGFCLRYPWKAADQDFSLLDEGKKLAARHGKAFCVRFMAGRHTPERIFANGCPFYTVPGYRGRGGPNKVPAPMQPDGSANAVFERHYDLYVEKLARWCHSNNVHLLHLAWYGQDWAELNHGKEVRALPGYSYNRWFAAHTRLIDIGLKHGGTDLAVEFPFSGHGPVTAAANQFAAHVIEKTGPANPIFFCQANGWGPKGDWGAPNAETEAAFDQVWQQPICRGLQMIQPQDYDWPAVFAKVYENNATYCEVYAPSFGLQRKDLLAAEIKKFARHVAEKAPMPATMVRGPGGEK